MSAAYFDLIAKSVIRHESVGIEPPATDVLNVAAAKDENAEKHLCPMPLNITRRALDLYSNRGDVILSPFAGVGSEGVAAIGKGRRFIGTELNPPYFRQAIKNLEAAKPDMDDLFAEVEAA